MEPPFRILMRALFKYAPISIENKALWEISDRPAYLVGVLAAAQLARAQGEREISVIEFGVAGGDGLVILQNEAENVERETGVSIKVYGFDSGGGLPPLIGDYRDHPDFWKPGDFRMDEGALRARLAPRTTLILGDVRETAASFIDEHDPPKIGFVSFDLDLYSATASALKVFAHQRPRMLRQVPLYFDDIGLLVNHRFAGGLLAIDEFNEASAHVKIDRWYGLADDRPFPERHFIPKMYVAHDLRAISDASLERNERQLPLRT